MNFDPGLIKRALEAIPYPVGKAQLVELARQHGINDQVVGMLEMLPDKTFNSAEEVEELINKGTAGLGNLGNLGNLGGFFK